MIGRMVLVRTYSAGVHIGVLTAMDGKVVTLTESRRLWRWRGANSLNEVALHGCAQEWTRLSEPLPQHILTEAIEICPVSAPAIPSLTTSRWAI